MEDLYHTVGLPLNNIPDDIETSMNNNIED